MTKDFLSVNFSKHIKINILFFPIIIASILGRYFTTFIATYLCALIHEATHIYVAKRLGIKVSHIELLPFGVCAKLKSDIIKNPSHEILIALSGPLSNILLALAAYIMSQFSNLNRELLSHLFYCNIAMASLNLIPALPLDGGRILRATLTLKTGSLYAYNYTVRISKISVAVLITISLALLFTQSFNFSLLLIGAFLLGSLFAEQKNITKYSLTEILNYKTKLPDDDISKAYVVTARKDVPARKMLRHLSYNNYHIIHIINDNLKIVKTITEGELIDALTKKGVRITLGDI